jgi:hypothetical protein
VGQFARWLYPILLLLEALIFHARVLFYPGYVFPWDFRGVHLPLATFVAGSLRRGEFPLWDPFTYCGVPIYANIQTALFYPPVLAATLAAAWLGDETLPRLLAIAVVCQIVFAGVCTYALVRRMGASPAASWIAGTMYELGCFFAAQAEHMGAMQGAAWLPLIWWSVMELRERRSWFWTAALAGGLSMTILAGLPQIAVAAFFSSVVLGIALSVAGLFRPRAWWSIPIACGWALFLAAVQLVPTAELMHNSVAKYRTEWLGGGGGISPGAFVSLLIPNYWSVFDPAHFHGPGDLTFLYLYSSLVGLALAVAAIVWKPSRSAMAFSLLTLAVTLVMLGEHTPLWRALFPWLPLQVRIGVHPEFLFCAFSLGLAILAGLGAQRFLKERWKVAAGALIVCDLILVGAGRPMNGVSLAQDPGFSPEAIRQLREATGRTVPPARFDTRPEVSFSWESNAPLLGIPAAGGCDPLAPERMILARLSFSPGPRWGTCFHVVEENSPVAKLMNVGVLVGRDAKLSENPGVLPRFFLVNRVQAVRDLDEAAALLHRPAFDPASTAIVEGDVRLSGPAMPGRVRVVSYRASALSLAVQAGSDSFLVATDSYYPGWLATLDGQPVRLYATNVAFRGITVPSGDHRIEMRFAPRILWWSAGVSAVALLLLIFCLAV